MVDVMAVVEDAARNWAPRAIAQGIDLGFALAPARILAKPRSSLHFSTT